MTAHLWSLEHAQKRNACAHMFKSVYHEDYIIIIIFVITNIQLNIVVAFGQQK